MITERNDLGHLIVATAADVDSIEWVADDNHPGVRHKVLWQSGATVLGLMEVDPGAENPQHSHHAAHHHILILAGSCQMLGKSVGPGSYLYIPPGVPHAARNEGPEVCRFFYTYRPLEIDAQDDPIVVT